MAERRAVIPLEHPRLRGYTPLDLLTLAYFTITGVILAIGRSRIPSGTSYLLLHIAVVVAILLLGQLPRRGNIVIMFLRDTYTLWALPFFYKEVGVLNDLVWSVYFDSTVIGWELALFGLQPSLYLREWFPFRVLDEFLHFSYLAYYLLVPILGFWLYLRGREELCRVFATSVMLTFFTCYLIFIFFPVAGPYYVFVQDRTGSGIFPPLVHLVLGSGASRGAAFPSSHVAGAVTVFWMSARFEKPISPIMGLLCGGIFFGTVYGGFHYAVDALGGLVLGILCSLAGPALHASLLRRVRLGPMRFRFPHFAVTSVISLKRLRRRSKPEEPPKSNSS